MPRRQFWNRTAALLVVGVLAASCGGTDPDATEVMGIQVDRTPDATPTSESPSAQASPTPTTSEAPAAVETTPASTPAATEAPPPPPPPPPPAYELPSGEGDAPLVWTPAMDEDSCCWIETSSARVERDDPAHQAVSGRLFDAVPPGPDEEPVERQQRWATCEPSLVAPDDQPMRVSGTLTTAVLRGDTMVAATEHRIDDTLAAGQRVVYPRVEPVLVDAADGQAVHCSVRFDAA